MYQVKFTTAFKRSYKLIQKRGWNTAALDEVVDTLRQGKNLGEQYRDHGLTGRLHGFRECHIEPDWLLIYYVERDVLTLTLVDTGSHSDLCLPGTPAISIMG